MSVDTVFQPKGPTFGLTNTAAQVIPPGTGPGGMVSFRIQCVGTAAQRIGWGPTSASTSSSAPAAGASANSISLAGGAVITLELPASTFFISSAAYVAGTSGFEVTPGQGFTST
jgi:hypothetical protein